MILIFHSIYDYFALLKAFNTNTFNYHQYFKDKLSSHQPSDMHNTRHRTNNNLNTPVFNHSKMLFVPSNSYMEQLPSSFKNCTSHSKKQIISHLLASQSWQFFNYQIQQFQLIIQEYMSPYLVLLPILECFSCPISHAGPMGLIQYYQITSQPFNQLICFFIIMSIVFCKLVSIKCIIVCAQSVFDRRLFNLVDHIV